MSKSSNVDRNIKKLKGRVYGVIFVFCILLIVIFMFNSNLFLISRVAISNNEVLSDKEILSLSGIEVSDNIFRVKLSEVRERLLSSPRVKDVKIERKLPNKLTFDIKERKEYIAIKYIGIYFIIDEERYIIETKKDNSGYYQVDGLEVISYKDGTKLQTVDDYLLDAIIKLCEFVEVSELGFKPNFKIENDEISMYINQDYLVKFGNGEEIEDRFNKFYSIYQDLKIRTINSGVININHSGYPSYVPYDD